jgi:hypothetical protein
MMGVRHKVQLGNKWSTKGRSLPTSVTVPIDGFIILAKQILPRIFAHNGCLKAHEHFVDTEDGGKPH